MLLPLEAAELAKSRSEGNGCWDGGGDNAPPEGATGRVVWSEGDSSYRRDEKRVQKLTHMKTLFPKTSL